MNKRLNEQARAYWVGLPVIRYEIEIRHDGSTAKIPTQGIRVTRDFAIRTDCEFSVWYVDHMPSGWKAPDVFATAQMAVIMAEALQTIPQVVRLREHYEGNPEFHKSFTEFRHQLALADHCPFEDRYVSAPDWSDLAPLD